MSRKPALFVTGLVSLAVLWALAPAAAASHYGIDVWIMEPTTIYDTDPQTNSPNSFLSDGKGPYWETPDTFAHLHDYLWDQNYADYFFIRDQKGTKRYMKLNISGVTNGSTICAKDVHFYLYPWNDPDWFNNMAVGTTTAAYGDIECHLDTTQIFAVKYTKETWCLTITRLLDTPSGNKVFRFSAPETCLADVEKRSKTGKSTWVTQKFGSMPVPFDVDSVAARTMETA